ncbi:molybdenum cofactor biosynthesis protein A [archaeon BMS3Abin17]|nr:molybdenum cofactor biosynthesis protein A [archaeon BMS3Abin17]HDZ61229.1 radical SAM/SPASM domain-containing protein [Candidatus Pacearchaeota archaeon]
MNIKNFIQETRYYLKLEGFARPFKKFLLYQSPLSRIVNSRLYGAIYLKRIKKEAERITPKILQIETTNACNAKCLMCPHKTMKRKISVMGLENFKKILDNVMKNYDIKRLTINGFGEPFTDKGVIEKIKYVNKKYPKLKVDIYSNAALLTKKRADELLKTNLGRVTFSINGIEEDYNKVMGLDYENTKRNVLYFLKNNKEKRKPALTNISMMILKENEEKAQNFVNFWRKYSDSVRAYFPSDWAGTLKEYVGEQNIPYGRRQWTCSALWTHIVIHSKGEFVVCCRDYESRVKFGNLIKGDDIKKLRESKAFKELQKQHLNFDFSSPVCKNCDHAYDSSIEWWLW